MENQDQKQENTDEILLEALDSIRPNTEEFIARRINHINFARTIFWFCVKSRKEDFFYTKELCKFIRLSIGRTHHIVNEILNGTDILQRKIHSDTMTHINFKRDPQGNPLVWKYFEQAKKTLGLKFSLK